MGIARVKLNDQYSTKTLMTALATVFLGTGMAQKEQEKIPKSLTNSFTKTDCKYAHTLAHIRLLIEHLIKVEAQSQALVIKLHEKIKNNPKAQADIKQSLEPLESSIKHIRDEQEKLKQLRTELQNGVTHWQSSNQTIANKIVNSPDTDVTYKSSPIQMTLNKAYSEAQNNITKFDSLFSTAETIVKHAIKTNENVIIAHPEIIITREEAPKLETSYKGPTSGASQTPG